MNNNPLPKDPKGLLNNPKNRAIIFQVVALFVVVFFAFYFANNMLDNIESRGITTGFSFLNNTAGFGISQTLIPYDDST